MHSFFTRFLIDKTRKLKQLSRDMQNSHLTRRAPLPARPAQDQKQYRRSTVQQKAQLNCIELDAKEIGQVEIS